jgi:NADH:ubiquinone oxidoreductase subunit C
MSEANITELLRRILGGSSSSMISMPRNGRIFVNVNRENLRILVQSLKNEGFSHLSAITGLEAEDGIKLLYHMSSSGTILTLRVKIPLNDATAPTIMDIIPGATLYEREVHDLLGVKFEGHGNLERLILPDSWPENKYPLRKRSVE